MMRKIIHVDMDAFYASVEQRDNPELRGKPIAVGHEGGRGVVAAASYEARRFGVRSAMPSATARRRCPSLIFVDGRMDVYKQVSSQIHEIFHRYTDIIEPISLDEAFLDVTKNKPGIELAVDIAKRIKKEIREELHLVASAGVSYNKFLAKIASDYRKPDGLCTIHPSRAQDFIKTLPVESFWGVGPVTAKKMHSLGIHTGSDLAEWSADLLIMNFGKAGQLYYDFVRGIDNRPVEPVRIRKSLSCEHTLERDILDLEELSLHLREAAEDLYSRINRKDFSGCTLTLKLKFYDFTNISRSITRERDFGSIDEIYDCALRLLKETDLALRPVRLIGIGVSNPQRDRQEEVWRQLTFDFYDGLV
ncbi:MAG: DNA polymerase IV [Paramuribaculum sp.]|nr:DNA polymerase IV [Paramuribaculum sp.]